MSGRSVRLNSRTEFDVNVSPADGGNRNGCEIARKSDRQIAHAEQHCRSCADLLGACPAPQPSWWAAMFMFAQQSALCGIAPGVLVGTTTVRSAVDKVTANRRRLAVCITGQSYNRGRIGSSFLIRLISQFARPLLECHVALYSGVGLRRRLLAIRRRDNAPDRQSRRKYR